MESPRELCRDLHFALCNALGYLDLCLDGDVPPDKLKAVMEKAAMQAKRALDTELELFKAIKADKFPVVQ